MDANAGQKDETLRKIIDMCEEKYRHYRQILDDLVDEVLDSEEEGMISVFHRKKEESYSFAENCRLLPNARRNATKCSVIPIPCLPKCRKARM